MSDLVSRSELLKFLDEEVKQIHIDEEINHIDTNAVKGMYAVLKAITNFIKEQQTAYDVEKVVEQLDELKICTEKGCEAVSDEECNKYSDCGVCLVDRAIQIVKRSGVGTDDVCEWEGIEKEYIQNPHTKRLYSNEPSMKNIYCNTCGKKIKVVESEE